MTYKRFLIDKLVRDNIPELLQQKAVIVQENTLSDAQFVESLTRKLEEEVQEVKNSQNREELIEELADLLEVILSLTKQSNITLDEIEKVRKEKKNTKGGFDLKRYVHFVDIHEENSAIEYYRKKVADYPEVAHHSQDSCLFCKIAQTNDNSNIIQRFPHCFALYDQFPVSKGHVLIIPYTHVKTWFDAGEELRKDIIKAIDEMKKRLQLELNPDGFNLGANCGEVAGQSIMHLHIHLIPRYQGDMENPKGGVRGVIPSKQAY
jgi:diadenosine tetraphosphate (Ap4A) HIT family hydrolase/predicted house-cleaning noncanonical NTP pyrophosphatase (MazG superfamily)